MKSNIAQFIYGRQIKIEILLTLKQSTNYFTVLQHDVVVKLRICYKHYHACSAVEIYIEDLNISKQVNKTIYYLINSLMDVEIMVFCKT